MRFSPLHDGVVLRRINAEAKSKGGIIAPDSAREKPQEDVAIAAGPGAQDEKDIITSLDVRHGDLVLFGKSSGIELKVDGEDLLIVKEMDIVGIVKGSPVPQKAA